MDHRFPRQNRLRAAFENISYKLRKYAPHHTEPLWKRVFGWALLIGAIGFLIGLIAMIIFTAVLSIGLPDVRDLDKLTGAESTLIYDRNGDLLFAFHGEENRKYTELDQISDFLQKATIAIEDDQFYSHIGFDAPALAKAVFHEVTGIGVRRGGSTITQQLAKNAFLSREKSYTRKLRELILSIRLERVYEKEQILELYLNRIPYGNNAHGAELASQVYFGKTAAELTLPEAAILAGLPQAPSYYSPYGENAFSKLDRTFDSDEIEARNIHSLADLNDDEYTLGLTGKTIELSEDVTIDIPGRADLVLGRMLTLGYINEVEFADAKDELRRIEFKRFKTNIRAPHFVFYIRQLLEEKYGTDAVESGGLRVYTTIDPDLQVAAEDIVAKVAETNLAQHNTQNAALLSADAQTGEVLTMVGSSDFFNDDINGKVNHVFAMRQPGSSFKPFVYAKSFLEQYSPATVLYDVRTNFGGGYVPNNFDGEFWGPMGIRLALAQSRNIPAIKAYFLAGQEDEVLDFVETLGVTQPKKRKPKGGYGPSLAIGTAETTMFDMVHAYMIFADSGDEKPIQAILRVEDREGEILEEWNPEGDVEKIPTLDPQVAYLINDILSTEDIKFGNYQRIGRPLATKTGTSNKKLANGRIAPSNAWLFGYTPNLVTGVWTGNSDGSALAYSASGYSTSGPIFKQFMEIAVKGRPNENFTRPEGIQEISVSKASGTLPSSVTPADQRVSEKFASFAVPTETDNFYIEVEVNKLDNKLPTPFTPKEHIEKRTFINHRDPIDTFGTWEVGVRGWIAEKVLEEPSYPNFPPTETTKMFTAETAGQEPSVKIDSPSSFSTLAVGQHEVSVSFSAPNFFDYAEFYLGDHMQFREDNPERGGKVRANIRINNFTKKGKTTITVKVFDKSGYVGRASIDVIVGEKEQTDEPLSEIQDNFTPTVISGPPRPPTAEINH